jgi:hypothetical protein
MADQSHWGSTVVQQYICTAYTEYLPLGGSERETSRSSFWDGCRGGSGRMSGGSGQCTIDLRCWEFGMRRGWGGNGKGRSVYE